MYQKDLSDDNYIEILFLIRLCKRDGKGEISWYIIAGFLFLFFLVSIDLVFVMNLSWDGVTLRFLDSLVFVVKKCTHRGCKILQCIFFLFCSKNQTISKQRAHRPIPMWSFEANDNGFANFFFENVHLIYDLQMQLSRLFELLSQLAGFVKKCSSVFICKILKVE